MTTYQEVETILIETSKEFILAMDSVTSEFKQSIVSCSTLDQLFRILEGAIQTALIKGHNEVVKDVKSTCDAIASLYVKYTGDISFQQKMKAY